MLNLLFISDSPKIAYIKKALQPLLKVIIDVVPDFDRGLKEVFEKRPATVCIQDQIAGVSGENVARHIQMLLGTGAPTFILIHEGSSKAKHIEDLFEYVVDLDQPEAKLSEEILSTLKVLIGDQWDKVFIPPIKMPASGISLADLPVESRNDADKTDDNVMLDLETGELSAVDGKQPALPPESEVERTDSSIAQTTSDELSEMMWGQADFASKDKNAAERVFSENAGHDYKSRGEVKPEMLLKPPVANTAPSFAGLDFASDPVRDRSALQEPKQKAAPANGKEVELPASDIPAAGAARTVLANVGNFPPITSADLYISKRETPAGANFPEDMLLTFEENYRLKSNARKRVLLSVFVLLFFVAIGGWYFVKQNPGFPASMKQQTIPVVKPTPAPVASPPLQAAQPAPNEQKPAQAAVEKPPVPPLPIFIPRNGHDKLFADKNPGWERYADEQVEFRVFSADGKPKAFQILAIRDNVIPESLVKTVPAELAGSADYQISSRENKSGFLLLRGTVAHKADVLFYKKGSTVRAFVVSLR